MTSRIRSLLSVKILVMIFVCLISEITFSQDITNTLSTGGLFIIKDASNNYLTLDQSTGQVKILRTLQLENTTSQSEGIIFKGTDRFIHNYGTGNTFIGINSGNLTMTGIFNTATGYQSLFSNTTGGLNTASGIQALYYNTTGMENTASGHQSLFSNTIGSYNTASGVYSLASNTIGSQNTASGYAALSSNTTGNGNSATGYYSLHLNTTGFYNTANGAEALYSNTTGNYNTANGLGALYSNTTGDNNVASGYQSLYSNTSGYRNTSTGNLSLYYSTSGNDNVASGYQSLYYNTFGDYNTASGFFSLYSNTSGESNVASGYQSLYYNTTGHANTVVGAIAGPNLGNLFNTTALGYDATPTGDNQVRLGNSSVTSIGGYVGWTNLSDERYKTSVQENVKGLDFIMKLRPITYHLDMNKLSADLKENQRKDENGNITIESSESDIKSRYEKSQIVYSGFIAQEVEKAAKDLGYDFSGVDVPKNENDFYGLRYAEFVVPLVKAVQEQQATIQNQQSQIQNQEKIITELTKRISALERK